MDQEQVEKKDAASEKKEKDQYYIIDNLKNVSADITRAIGLLEGAKTGVEMALDYFEGVYGEAEADQEVES